MFQSIVGCGCKHFTQPPSIFETVFMPDIADYLQSSFNISYIVIMKWNMAPVQLPLAHYIMSAIKRQKGQLTSKSACCTTV